MFRSVFVLLILGLFVAFGAPGLLHHADASPDTISDTALLGGVDRRVHSDDFRGGEATAILGGVKLDLRDVTTSRSEVTLDVTALLGGVEVIVPRDWDVQASGTTLFGGFEDKSSAFRSEGKNRPRLIVKGTAVMGGVTIRR